jgi:pimeloyl-ACP methyl ester carboxylesterase
MAGRGHTVLRFDLSGHGDSEGKFEDFGFSDLERDVDEARDYLQTQTGGEPVLVGLRLGGTLAGRAAARHGSRAVLWEPVLNPSDWLMECLRANLAFQLQHHGKVNRNRKALVGDLDGGGIVLVDGYGITAKFYAEACASGGLLEGYFPGTSPASLTVAMGKIPERTLANYREIVAGWHGGHDAGLVGVREDPFWTDTKRYRTRSDGLIGITLDWIEGRPVEGMAPA